MAKPVAPFKIQKGIKLPPAKRKRSSRYPWTEMEVNDSFFIPGKSPKGLYTAAKAYGIKIAVRVSEERGELGIRVWRINPKKGKK